jgi:hypothetical protein
MHIDQENATESRDSWLSFKPTKRPWLMTPVVIRPDVSIGDPDEMAGGKSIFKTPFFVHVN